MHLDILYQDEALVAVNKPSGLLVHRNASARGDRIFALQLLRDQLGRRVYPVHRLDRATSGVLLFALDAQTTRRLTELFTEQRVEKRYLAVVRGWTAPEGVIDEPMREKSEGVIDAPLREAVTEYRRLNTVELPIPVPPHPSARYSLVEARPRTGRTHQIRRHLKRIAHPIVGDTTYGKGPHNRLFRDRYDCRRLLLAATHLGLPHPLTGEWLTLQAPLSGCFGAVVDALGWRAALTEEAA